ncbi:MAG: oxygenase MpaB family protein [Cyanobacteria bacterium]|nr:oxygenase MpaB family protein [Cyanobacteriota bacterium]
MPRISAILHLSGEFLHHPQKRYDDTGLLISNILKWGYDSPQGQAAIAQMNRIHSQYEIANEDFLYVLSASLCEPVRWNERYGWRPFTETEKQALFYFWRAVGDRMNIDNLPPTYSAFAQFKATYEAALFRYSPDNAAIGKAVITLMQSWFPATVSPWVPKIANVLIDDPMRMALGWAAPNPLLVTGVEQGLRLRRWGVRWLAGQRQPEFFADRPTLSYPQGYAIEQLGPVASTVESPPSRCPFLRMRQLLKV